MSEEKAEKVRDMTEELSIAMYQLSGFAEMLDDIIDEMPLQKDGEGYSIECCVFCIWAQKKLDVLTTQLMMRLKESGELVSALKKEVFAQ